MLFYRSDLKVSSNRELDKSTASPFSVKIIFFHFSYLELPMLSPPLFCRRLIIQEMGLSHYHDLLLKTENKASVSEAVALATNCHNWRQSQV